MEEDNLGWSSENRKSVSRYGIMSPEIIEIGEESKSYSSIKDDKVYKDVYVAVGKDDLSVLKWALNHVVSPGSETRVFLIHVFPPVTNISTPVGRISRNQVSKEYMRSYIKEENNRRSNLLHKYIRMCNDAKVTVETMLIESNVIGKAILELIPVLNITTLIIGADRFSYSRQLTKGVGKGEFVRMNAPEFCEITIVPDSKKVVKKQQALVGQKSFFLAARRRKAETTQNVERINFFDCVCFSGKFN
ncbi:hypothetical protein GIB67_004407 [Kingdonia uniflora]|uniref:Uncharacterized protein n=1 Tax=Kingdonia uniflora TaxID=39325 RepID=A0A7J7MRB4_9MAGN|nr:hypothetical protein GIB67_004407 [Kingdonia uniflora]